MPKVQPNIALEFDEFSGDYTRDMINCVPHYEQLMHTLVEALPENFLPLKILDMGCGNGNVTAITLKTFPNAKYHLIDASSEMIRICQSRFQDVDIDFWEGYFENFQYDHKPYDFVTASFSFHHIDSEEKQKVFQEIYNALNPGGILAMSDLMISKSSESHSDLIEEWSEFIMSNNEDEEKLKWIMEHYEAFDKPDHYEDQISWLKDAGFSKVKIAWREGFWVSLQAKK